MKKGAASGVATGVGGQPSQDSILRSSKNRREIFRGGGPEGIPLITAFVYSHEYEHATCRKPLRVTRSLHVMMSSALYTQRLPVVERL